MNPLIVKIYTLKNVHLYIKIYTSTIIIINLNNGKCSPLQLNTNPITTKSSQLYKYKCSPYNKKCTPLQWKMQPSTTKNVPLYNIKILTRRARRISEPLPIPKP